MSSRLRCGGNTSSGVKGRERESQVSHFGNPTKGICKGRLELSSWAWDFYHFCLVLWTNKGVGLNLMCCFI